MVVIVIGILIVMGRGVISSSRRIISLLWLRLRRSRWVLLPVLSSVSPFDDPCERRRIRR
jgi:hypothetical protein